MRGLFSRLLDKVGLGEHGAPGIHLTRSRETTPLPWTVELGTHQNAAAIIEELRTLGDYVDERITDLVVSNIPVTNRRETCVPVIIEPRELGFTDFATLEDICASTKYFDFPIKRPTAEFALQLALQHRDRREQCRLVIASEPTPCSDEDAFTPLVTSHAIEGNSLLVRYDGNKWAVDDKMIFLLSE